MIFLTHDQTQKAVVRLLLSGMVLLILAVIGSAPAQAQANSAQTPTTPAQTTVTAADDIALVRFQPHATEEERAAVIANMNGRLHRWLPQIQVAEVAVTPAVDRVSAASLAASLAVVAVESDAVLFAELDVVVDGTYATDDPGLADAEQSYALQLLHAPLAWNVTTGAEEIVIALLDTGINADHPEFAGRVVPGYDFVNDDDDPDDDNGHGTHTAGIVAAAVNNGVGSAGICPTCRIMPVKVLNQINAGSWSTVAQGILYAVDHGAQVINLSLGATKGSHTLEAAIDYAVAHDVLVVAAAGNRGSDEPFYPAAYEAVLAVSATDARDQRWSLSNFGSYVDVAAPGHLIFSTSHQLDNALGGYTYMSGTSMAAPLVAGLAGLVLSHNGALSADEVQTVLTSTAVDLGDSGWDSLYGAGRIDAARALDVATQVTSTSMTATNQIFLPLVTSR